MHKSLDDTPNSLNNAQESLRARLFAGGECKRVFGYSGFTQPVMFVYWGGVSLIYACLLVSWQQSSLRSMWMLRPYSAFDVLSFDQKIENLCLHPPLPDLSPLPVCALATTQTIFFLSKSLASKDKMLLA